MIHVRMILLAVRYVQNVRHPGGDDTKTTPENKRLQHQWKNKEWGGKNTAGCKGLQILCNPPALAINLLASERASFDAPRSPTSTATPRVSPGTPRAAACGRRGNADCRSGRGRSNGTLDRQTTNNSNEKPTTESLALHAASRATLRPALLSSLQPEHDALPRAYFATSLEALWLRGV